MATYLVCKFVASQIKSIYLLTAAKKKRKRTTTAKGMEVICDNAFAIDAACPVSLVVLNFCPLPLYVTLLATEVIYLSRS